VSIDVTVVMPVWSPRHDWVRQAVRSALDDTDCSLELLVIDDGNPEPVAEALSEIVDERLRVMRVEHGGAAAARNAGTANAQGRWLRFVDADDVVLPGSTGRLVGLAAGREDVVVYGATVVCDEDLRPLRTLSSTLEGDLVEACLLGRLEIRHVSALFPRAVVEETGGWESGFHASEDWDFMLRALELAAACADPVPATYYRRHAASRTGVADVAAGEADRRRLIERFLERHPEERRGSLARRAFTELYLDRGLAYAHAGQMTFAFDRLACAGRHAPVRAFATAVRALWLRARRAASRR
jgi:hypothetical protein